VTTEQAKSFRSKLWQLHIDSQRPPARTSAGAAGESTEEDTVLGHLNAMRASSRELNPAIASLPFKERLRPGMVVSFRGPKFMWPVPPGDFKMAVILCPADVLHPGVQDARGRMVNADAATREAEEKDPRTGKDYTTTDNDTGKRWLCALVFPGIIPEAYSVSLWRQMVLDEAWMDAEVFLEYDDATRYYFITL